VACTTAAHCTNANTPICNTMNHACAGCANDGECRTKNGATLPACVPAANPGAGSCVACFNDTHCPMPMTPICNVAVTARTCRACATDVDCRGKNTNLPACITATGTGSGSCVACTNDSHCMSAATPICDTMAHTCKACASDTECRAKNTNLPACITATGTGSGSCVACTNDSHCMTAIAPICNTGTHTCAACTSDAQCVTKLGSPDPGVCMFHTDGHCATPAEVLYVRAASGCSDLGTGLVTMPFCSPQAAVVALTPARPTIVIRGGTITTDRLSYVGGVSRLTVIGQDNAVIGPLGTVAQPLIGITVTGGDVYIRGLSVTGMSSVGILATTGATIRLDRCLVTDNLGGLAVNGAAFAINNCVFARNANNIVTALPASFGGVYLRGPATGLAQFRNNTIVDNQGAALVCGGAYQTRGLLVANNVGGTVTTCTTDGSSFISTTATIFNLTSPFHLTTGSPCIDREVGTTDFPADDLDGNARPSGTISDCGAHELQR
jgi:Right handed beta helix region